MAMTTDLVEMVHRGELEPYARATLA